MYKILIVIGDWSLDGHERYIEYFYESNKPVEEVREAHFKIKEIFGFGPEDFANEYEDNTMPDHVVESLEQHGIAISFEPDFLQPDDMVHVWVSMLMVADPGLELKQVPTNDWPMLQFYGYDDQGRHINGVGYGLFE